MLEGKVIEQRYGKRCGGPGKVWRSDCIREQRQRSKVDKVINCVGHGKSRFCWLCSPKNVPAIHKVVESHAHDMRNCLSCVDVKPEPYQHRVNRKAEHGVDYRSLVEPNEFTQPIPAQIREVHRSISRESPSRAALAIGARGRRIPCGIAQSFLNRHRWLQPWVRISCHTSCMVTAARMFVMSAVSPGRRSEPSPSP